MTELRTEDRWPETFHPNLHLNLKTRTRYPTAETWDLEVSRSWVGAPLRGVRSPHVVRIRLAWLSALTLVDGRDAVAPLPHIPSQSSGLRFPFERRSIPPPATRGCHPPPETYVSPNR